MLTSNNSKLHHRNLSGRPVKYVHISPVQTHFLLVAYGPVKEQAKATSQVSLFSVVKLTI